MAREMKDSGIQWLGAIPNNWNCIKGKYIFIQRSEKGNKISLELLSPTQKFGVIPQKLYEELTTNTAVKVQENTNLELFKTIHKGDYCISLRSFQGGFEYSYYEGVVSPAYQVFYPIQNVCKEYYKYLFKDQNFIDKMNSYTMSLRDGKNIAFSDFGNTYIPIPPINEQKKIADYLDKKCAEIDSLVTDIQSQIEILEDYKKSVITEAVTKGLNPDVEMKDSGIEWIGKIPKDWTRYKIKNVCSLIGSGTTPTSGNLEFYEDGTINWIQSGDIYGKTVIKDVATLLTTKALTINKSLKVYKAPYIVIAMYGGSVGNVAISKIDACTNQACCCIKPDETTYLQYLFYWVSFCKYDFLHKAEGGGQPNISQEKIKNQIFFKPSLREQKEIVEYLDSKCEEIGKAIKAKNTQLDILEQYKKSLIYEYVTGKKEVPNNNE